MTAESAKSPRNDLVSEARRRLAVIDAQSRARAIRAVVAAQWAEACAQLVAVDSEHVSDDDEPNYRGVLVQRDGQWFASIYGIEPHLWAFNQLRSAEQIVDGAA